MFLRFLAKAKRQSQPRVFPTSGWKTLDENVKVEEELLPIYKHQNYHPTKIGEVLKGRYQVVAKLGYGGSGIVWLSRDLLEQTYVAIKIQAAGSKSDESREYSMLKHIAQVKSDLTGREYIRTLLESFYIDGPSNKHLCLIQEPLGSSLWEWKSSVGPINLQALRFCFQRLMIGLYYLHNAARIVHTDVQLNNLMMRLTDASILAQIEQDELEHPSPRKETAHGIIYRSKKIDYPFGMPLLSDFGEARFGDEEHWADIMPTAYRAPEVLLAMKWSYPVDIWAAALTMWDFFFDKNLFNINGPNDKPHDHYHVAELIGLLGPPPKEFLQRHENTLVYWDESGKWKHTDVLIRERKLEETDFNGRLEGEEKEGFLDLLRGMLAWNPEDRLTAAQCVMHPWLIGKK